VDADFSAPHWNGGVGLVHQIILIAKARAVIAARDSQRSLVTGSLRMSQARRAPNTVESSRKEATKPIGVWVFAQSASA
jgi:hypothetical protein